MKQVRTVIQTFTVPVSLGFIDGQIPYLKQKGITVRIICSDGAALPIFAQKYGIDYDVVPFKRAITPLHDLVCLWHMYRILRGEKPAIVHGNTPKAGLLSMLAAWLAGVPVRVYEIHGFPFESRGGLSRWLLMSMERLSCRVATHVLAVSDSLRNQAVKLAITKAAKVTVPHHGSCNGVDALNKFNPENLDARKLQQLRENLNLKGTVIGFVGRLTRDKGVVELASAWKMLRGDYPDVTLLLIGASELEPFPEKEKVDEMLQDSRVRQIGYVLEMAYYYALLNFILLPTYREGLPNVLLEAGAMEVAAIASRVTGTVDALIEDQTGLFCEAYSAESLARQMRLYLDNPDLVRQHGQNARRWVLRDFNPVDIWQAKLAVYQRALQSAGIPLADSEKPSVPV
ncbi:glycosyltransferase family 4 protein [Larkinella arboricola]